MKILVVSDSHGDVENMCRAVERERPDLVMHLGDGWHDAEVLRSRYPALPIEQVPGNCDFRGGTAATRILVYEGKRILLCHGHTLGVKGDLSILMREAMAQGVDVALFGHTHRPFVELRNGVWLLNPGSIGDYRRPTYGTLLLGDGTCYPSLWTV
ncbi:MAG: metallophosphoesterase [Oscillospiraceae bacterium]|nr:metallophosphoesterase [Oscillospiraceae bacterium]